MKIPGTVTRLICITIYIAVRDGLESQIAKKTVCAKFVPNQKESYGCHCGEEDKREIIS